MRFLTSIAAALTRLLSPRTVPASDPQRTTAHLSLGAEDVAMLRAGLAPTRMGFRSKWSVAISLLLTASASVSVVALWVWAERAETPDAAAATTALALGLSGILAIGLGFVIAWATTWRTDDSSAFHMLRRLGWWGRVIGARAYAGLLVCYAGLSLLVLAYHRPEADQRDFDVLAAVGISVTSAGIGITIVAFGVHFRRRQSLRSSVEHHIGLLENGIPLSLDADAEQFARLRIGLGSAGPFAMPVIDPAKSDQALFLYSRTQEPSDLLVVL